MGQQASNTKVSGHAFYFHVGVSKITIGEELWEVVKVVDGGCSRFKIAVEPGAGQAACGSGLVTECQPLGSAAVLITPGTCHGSCEPVDPSCHPFLGSAGILETCPFQGMPPCQ